MRSYIGLIHKEAGSDFGVSFPDFPGAITAGNTLDEVRHRAEEMLIFHIEGMLQDGDPVPEPSSLEIVMADAQNRDGVAILVPVKIESSKSVRVNVTIAADLLEQIDRHAAREGLSRSGFLAKAAKRSMEFEKS